MKNDSGEVGIWAVEQETGYLEVGVRGNGLIRFFYSGLYTHL